MAKEVTTKETIQSVKNQRYTITKFNGDYKDWLRFWNQCTVEVDGSSLPEISKFNYLLGLVQRKPKEDVLGLPRTIDGYEEAKRILKETYGKDINVHKALILELETLPEITNIRRTRDIHEFYNRLARVFMNTQHYAEDCYCTSTCIPNIYQTWSSERGISQKREQKERLGLGRGD